MQKFFQKKIQKSNIEHLIPNKNFVLSLNFRPFIEFFFVAFSIFIIIYVVNLNTQKDLILSNLILFIIILSRIIPSVNRISYNFQKIRFCKEPIKSIYYLIKNQPSSDLSLNKQDNAEKIIFNNEIDFKDISFSYEKEQEPVIKNLNFKIKKGDLIGIYGDSG